MYAMGLFMAKAFQSEWVWCSSDDVMWEGTSFGLVVLLLDSSPEPMLLAVAGNGVLCKTGIWSSLGIATFLFLQLLYLDTFSFLLYIFSSSECVF